jgi:hypothetical protein
VIKQFGKKKILLLYNFFGKLFNEPNQTNGDVQGSSSMNISIVD